MSRFGKVFWFIAGLSVLILGITRFIIGGWIDILYIPLSSFLLFFVLGLIFDFKFYLEIFTAKTTKRGLNLSVAISLFIVILVSINYLGVRYNVFWDATDSKLNSVALETKKILDDLKAPIFFKIFYRGKQDTRSQTRLRDFLAIYKRVSRTVNIEFIDAYVENEVAQKYLKDVSRMTGPVFFIEYKNKKVKVKSPFEEAEVTSAIVQAVQSKSAVVYFLEGHGERKLDVEDVAGLSQLKEQLLAFSISPRTLNLIQTNSIPKDADILAIVGSKGPLLTNELKLVRNFVKSGKNLFIAVDPGQGHNLALLTKSFGIGFQNNYILNDRLQIQGRGRAGALGLIFSQGSEITRDLGEEGAQKLAVFDLASSLLLEKTQGRSSSFLVKSAPNSYAFHSLGRAAGKEFKSFDIGAISVKSSSGSKVASSVVVFGDSDFLSNKDFNLGLNADLALNSFQYLNQNKKLINIKPKKPKGTQLHLTQATTNIIIVVGLFLPIIFFAWAAFLWFRRRNA